MTDEPQREIEIENLSEENVRARVRAVFGLTEADLVRMETATEAIIAEKCDEYEVERHLVGGPGPVLDTMLATAFNHEMSDKLDHGRIDMLKRELLERGQPAHNNVSLALGMLSTYNHEFRPLMEAVFERKYGGN